MIRSSTLIFDAPRKDGTLEKVKIITRPGEIPAILYRGKEHNFERVARALRHIERINKSRNDRYHRGKEDK